MLLIANSREIYFSWSYEFLSDLVDRECLRRRVAICFAKWVQMCASIVYAQTNATLISGGIASEIYHSDHSVGVLTMWGRLYHKASKRNFTICKISGTYLLLWLYTCIDVKSSVTNRPAISIPIVVIFAHWSVSIRCLVARWESCAINRIFIPGVNACLIQSVGVYSIGATGMKNMRRLR